MGQSQDNIHVYCMMRKIYQDNGEWYKPTKSGVLSALHRVKTKVKMMNKDKSPSKLSEYLNLPFKCPKTTQSKDRFTNTSHQTPCVQCCSLQKTAEDLAKEVHQKSKEVETASLEAAAVDTKVKRLSTCIRNLRQTVRRRNQLILKLQKMLRTTPVKFLKSNN